MAALYWKPHCNEARYNEVELYLEIRVKHTQLLSFPVNCSAPLIYEPPREKTNNLHKRKQRHRTAKLISAFVFATRIVHFLVFLNPKFQASSLLLWLCSLICVRPVRKPHCWFSHKVALIVWFLWPCKLTFDNRYVFVDQTRTFYVMAL